MDKIGLKWACITLVVCMAAAIAAPAQTFTTLYSFYGTDGGDPQAGLIQATDGNFYGTTAAGGEGSPGCWGLLCGTVFRITPAGTLTTLYNFCAQTGCIDGALPTAGLIQATDGNFYGTTEGGGLNNCNYLTGAITGCGTIFKITPGGTLTTLYSFCALAGCPDGANPRAGLVQATDGNFYGTTVWGGTYGGFETSGTVFKITPGGALTTLHSFDSTDGSYLWARLIQAGDGNFYGTASLGGSGGNGTVFKMTPAGALTTLHSFGWIDGSGPTAGLIQATDGDFYGTTLGGGAAAWGTIFKITHTGGLTTLYNFCLQKGCPDGAHPSAGLIQATDGNFYGTTGEGGGWRDRGTLFEITGGGTLGTVHRFDITDGALPGAALIQATDGSFYGTTAGGGIYGDGTIFRLVAVPAVTLSSTSLSFGSQALDESSPAKTVTLKNSGTALLLINNVAIDGSSFVISASTCGDALAPGKKCKVSVTFTPTVLGKQIGTLKFTDNAPNSPQTVTLSGRGVEPATLAPARATYATQAVGTTSPPKTFTLTNNQSVTLTGIVISTSGDFAVSTTTCGTNLAAKKKCSISVTFTPTQIGTRTGQLSVSDSANNSPQISNLKGPGI